AVAGCPADPARAGAGRRAAAAPAAREVHADPVAKGLRSHPGPGTGQERLPAAPEGLTRPDRARRVRARPAAAGPVVHGARGVPVLSGAAPWQALCVDGWPDGV